MSQSQILDIIRHDAAAFDMDPVLFLLDQAVASRIDGDTHSARHALRNARTFRGMGHGPRLP